VRQPRRQWHQGETKSGLLKTMDRGGVDNQVGGEWEGGGLWCDCVLGGGVRSCAELKGWCRDGERGGCWWGCVGGVV